MELLNLRLQAIRGNARKFLQRQKHPKFVTMKTMVHQRDNNTCRYCGFQSDDFLYVTNIDQNYSHNRLDNMASACPFCAQCFLLDGIGLHPQFGGTVVYMPELSQADLNHFCRVLFCSLLKDAPYKGKLQATYLSLQDRGHEIDSLFGPNTHQAATFGQSFIDSHLDKNQNNHPILSQLRLLPARKPFKGAIDYWRNTVFAKIPL